VLLVLGVGIYLIYANTGTSGEDISDVPTAVARLTTLIDKVVEQGELESQSTITGKCEIQSYDNKLIFLAPEGSIVEKDEIVAKFDTSEIDKQITERTARVNEEKTEVEAAEQELKVQKDENASLIRKAKQTLDFAKLDLKKYQQGDYLVSRSEIEGTISEAQTTVDKDRRNRENMRALVKRGIRSYEQLREAEQVVKSAELRLKSAKQKLNSLVKFEHVKSLAEFEGLAIEAEFALKAAKTTAAAKLAQAKDKLKNEKRGLKIQQSRLDEEKKNLAKHVMAAPQKGTLAYGRNRWDGEKAHEGGTIYRNQPVFVLPDMNRMQVKVGVHETLVSKVKVKQKALVKVDAFSDKTLYGTVKSVSPLSASTRRQASNNYQVVVTIDEFPKKIKLKPGMTAEVEIYVGKYEDVLAVPIGAVTSFGNKKFVFVKNAKGEFESREVKVGSANLSFVAIEEGLETDQVVALDAYQRGLASFDPDDLEAGSSEGDSLALSPEEQAAVEEADAAEKKKEEEKKKAEEVKKKGEEAKTKEQTDSNEASEAQDADTSEKTDKDKSTSEDSETSEDTVETTESDKSQPADSDNETAEATESSTDSASLEDSDSPILE